MYQVFLKDAVINTNETDRLHTNIIQTDQETILHKLTLTNGGTNCLKTTL